MTEEKAAEHRKKMAAPIAVAALFLAFLIFYAAGIALGAAWHPALLLAALPLGALGAGMIYSLRARIREIRSGEEDDLDNY